MSTERCINRNGPFGTRAIFVGWATWTIEAFGLSVVMFVVGVVVRSHEPLLMEVDALSLIYICICICISEYICVDRQQADGAPTHDQLTQYLNWL